MSLVLKQETDDQAKLIVLTVLGEVDIATVGQLGEALQLLDDGYSLVLDLTSTSFMDSSGLRLIVETNGELAARGQQLKIAANGAISRLIEVTGLRDQLDVHESVEEATSA
jgi:anti-anti-sigma factor